MLFKIVPDVMRTLEPVALGASGTVLEAVRQMHLHDVGAVLVVEGDTLIGIFTERDVAYRVVAAGLDIAATHLREVMTPDPFSIQADALATAALAQFAEHNIRHLPVYEGKSLIGVVALRDIQRVANKQFAQELDHMSVEIVADCQIRFGTPQARKLITLPSQASVRQAVEAMKSRDTGAVLVEDDDVLRGIFTERDVIKHIATQGIDPETTPIARVMTVDPSIIRPGENCDVVTDLMQEGQFRHLPIVENGRAVGILSIRDLYRFYRVSLEAQLNAAMIERTRQMIAHE